MSDNGKHPNGMAEHELIAASENDVTEEVESEKQMSTNGNGWEEEFSPSVTDSASGNSAKPKKLRNQRLDRTQFRSLVSDGRFSSSSQCGSVGPGSSSEHKDSLKDGMESRDRSRPKYMPASLLLERLPVGTSASSERRSSLRDDTESREQNGQAPVSYMGECLLSERSSVDGSLASECIESLQDSSESRDQNHQTFPYTSSSPAEQTLEQRMEHVIRLPPAPQEGPDNVSQRSSDESFLQLMSLPAEDMEELLAQVPKDESGEPTSIGSKGHTEKACRPCSFVFASIGCKHGVLCKFCHYYHKRAEMVRPSKSKRLRLRKIHAQTSATTENDEPVPGE